MGIESSRSRRAFIRHMGALMASGAASAFIPQLRVISRALAEAKSVSAGASDYRALVCVYLQGGLDSFNWLVPIDDAPYAEYKDARNGIYDSAGLLGTTSGLAIPRAQDPNSATTLLPLLPVTLAGGAGSYGINGYCPELQTLFNNQRLAFVANVGTLVQPLTKDEYTHNSKPKPFQLYSHNDQTNLWQLGQSDPNSKFGWGGHAASFVQGQNAGNQVPTLSPCISVGGSNRFEIGPGVVPYQMTSGGATQLRGYYAQTDQSHGWSSAIQDTLGDLLALEYDSLYTNEYRATLGRSIGLGTDITSRLVGATLNPDPFAGISNNSLASQLSMVARMIRICSDPAVGIKRQIYFVQLGGFDSHTAQFTSNSRQQILMQRISVALNAFYTALAMPEVAMENNVLTFTISDFARTLSSNGSGSDHAWGGIQMVMGNTDTLGGPLIGGRIYGTYPSTVLNGTNSLDRGQMIPDWAVEQMMAPFASWMGVQSGDLGTVFPNLSNFSGNLSFLA